MIDWPKWALERLGLSKRALLKDSKPHSFSLAELKLIQSYKHQADRIN